MGLSPLEINRYAITNASAAISNLRDVIIYIQQATTT